MILQVSGVTVYIDPLSPAYYDHLVVVCVSLVDAAWCLLVVVYIADWLDGLGSK